MSEGKLYQLRTYIWAYVYSTLLGMRQHYKQGKTLEVGVGERFREVYIESTWFDNKGLETLLFPVFMFPT